MTNEHTSTWKCGLCGTKHAAWVRYCGCIDTERDPSSYNRTTECPHERLCVRLEDTDFKTKGQMLIRDDTWKGECQDCGEAFDVVWTGRTEDNRLYGLELIRADNNDEEQEEDEGHAQTFEG